MALSPETIAMILSVLLPMIVECLEKRETQGSIVSRIRNPNARLRGKLLKALPAKESKQLSAYWAEPTNRRMTRRLAVRWVRSARRLSRAMKRAA